MGGGASLFFEEAVGRKRWDLDAPFRQSTGLLVQEKDGSG